MESSPMAFPMGALSVFASIEGDKEISKELASSHRHFYADRDDPELTGKALAAEEPEFLALSLYLFNREWMYRFLSAFTSLNTSTTIFAGGPDVISSPDDLIERGISFLIVGEGESPVRHAVHQLLKAERPQRKGIYSKEKPVLTASYEEHLEELPSVILTFREMLNAYPGILWEMTRGCPFACSFCAESRGNRKVRHYPFSRLKQELEVIIQEGITSVFILDPTFNLEKKRTRELLSFLIEHSPPEIHYTFEVRGELLDEESVALFASLNCSLQIGLQSSSREVMERVDRAFDPERFVAGVSSLHPAGIVFGLDLIIALPGDTLASFMESVTYAVQLRPSNLDIFLLSLLPGTELQETKDTFALSSMDQSPYEVLETMTMSSQDIATALEIKNGCDIFYTKGEAVMWFIRVLEALPLDASEFFLRFSRYMEEREIDDSYDTFLLQEEFIRLMYHESGKEHLLPLILSYVELHQGLCVLTGTGESPVASLTYPVEALYRLDEERLEEVFSEEGEGIGTYQLMLYEWEGEVMMEEI